MYLSYKVSEGRRLYVKNSKTNEGGNMVIFSLNFWVGVLLGGAAATIYWKVLPGLKKTEKK
jgi:hypothetical protein